MASDSDTTNSKHPRLYIDILLMITIGVFSLIYYLGNRYFLYKAGLSFEAGLTLLKLWLLLAYCFVSIYALSWILIAVLVVRAVILIIRFSIKRLFFQIITMVVSTSFLFITPKYIDGGYVAFTEGFLQGMKREADVPSIQAWVDTLDSDALSEFKKDEYGWWVAEHDWPQEIKKFSPNYVLIRELGDGKRYVRIVFGGTMIGRWSFVVGVGAEEIPLNDYYISEHRLELNQNTFVGYRLKRIDTAK